MATVNSSQNLLRHTSPGSSFLCQRTAAAYRLSRGRTAVPTTVSIFSSSRLGESGSAKWRSAISSATGRSSSAAEARRPRAASARGKRSSGRAGRASTRAPRRASRGRRRGRGRRSGRSARPTRRGRDLDAVHGGKPLAIGVRDAPELRERVVQARQPRHRQRRARLVNPEVEPEARHVVGLGVAAVAVPGDRGHRVRAELAELGRRTPRSP